MIFPHDIATGERGSPKFWGVYQPIFEKNIEKICRNIEVKKNKEIKKSGTKGFIEFPRPLSQNTEVLQELAA